MHRQALLIVCVVACGLGAATRAGTIWLTAAHHPDSAMLPDEVQYWMMAQTLADGDGLRDELGYRAARMPLYPAWLSLFTSSRDGRGAALLCQAMFSALTCGFTALLAAQVAPQHLRIAAAGTAGLLTALDPFLTYLSRYLLTENLYVAGLSAFLAISWKTTQPSRRPTLWWWCGSAMIFTLCVYLRPSSVGLLVLWSAFLLLRRRFDRAAVVGTCCLWLMLGALLTPWAWRNQHHLGEWTWLTTRLGISLYDGVRPGADGASDLGAIKATGQDEVAWNAQFKSQSWDCIRAEPRRIVHLAGRKFMRTWNLWPNAAGYQQRSTRAVGALWTLAVLITATGGIVACWRTRRATIIGLLIPAAYFTALHMIFVGSVRYRLPAMPMIEVLSAIGLTTALMWRRQSSPPTHPDNHVVCHDDG